MNPRNGSLEYWEREALRAYLCDDAAYARIRSASELEALIRYASLRIPYGLLFASPGSPKPEFEQRLVALFAE